MTDLLERPIQRPVPKPGILDIAPYVGGKSKVEGVAAPIKLSSNENALGCSPLARAAYLEAAARLHVYPDGKAGGIRAAVAETFGLEPERLMFGCGSDEVFSLLCQVYLEPGDNMVQSQYGFLAFRIGARAMGAEVRFAPERDHTADVDALLDSVDARTRILFLANPGNPTGTYLSGAEVRRLHAALPPRVLLVHDGAYAEFVDDADYEDGLALAREAPNVVMTRTFSKLHGLAALRIGWGYGDPAIADAVERIRPPFNTTIPAQEAAVAALGDAAFLEASLAHVRRWRPWLTERIGALGLTVVPSATNFVLVRFEGAEEAAAADVFLQQRGIIVRAVAGYGLPDCLRITVGTETQSAALMTALTAFMEPSDG
jgi:histidinol-phosphate aminotransferase